MDKELSAGIIIYRMTRKGPRFLLLYSGGEYWNFPKGKLTEGEESYEAAIREVQEETGLGRRELKVRKWMKFHDHFTYRRNKRKIAKTVTYYVAETRTSAVKISEAKRGERHYGYGWFLYRDALRILKYPVLKQNLKIAFEAITHRAVPNRRNEQKKEETKRLFYERND